MMGLVHGFSHFYQLVLPPLFPLIQAETGISYTRLGLLMGVFYVTSGLLQTPSGFLVDRFGARVMLRGGLTLLASAIFLFGFAQSYETMVVLAIIGGAGNAVFHPADYAFMTANVSDRRMGRAYSVHSVGGHLGYAAAPTAMLWLGTVLGWHGALIAAGLAGIVPVLLLQMRIEAGPAGEIDGKAEKPTPADADEGVAAGLKILLHPTMVMLFAFFVLFAMSLIGLQSFTPTALIVLRDVSLSTATLALAGFLLGSPLGILAGGVIADRIRRHNAMAAGGITLSALAVLAIGVLEPPVAMLAPIFFISGFCFGSALPSRDMVVRSVTPKGSSGKVFGFVYSGLDVGAAASPVLFGWFLDIGHPSWIFLFAPVFLILSVAIILLTERLAGRT